MFGDMKEMFKQASEMRSVMKQKQKELAKRRFEVEVGGGMVKVVIAGDLEVKEISLEKELMEKEISVVETLVTSAVNAAIKKVQKETAADMQNLTKNLGGLGSLFNKG